MQQVQEKRAARLALEKKWTYVVKNITTFLEFSAYITTILTVALALLDQYVVRRLLYEAFSKL